VSKLPIKKDMETVLSVLAKAKRDEMGEAWVDAPQLQKDSNLSPANLNDAIELLVENGLVKWRQYLGTAPFKFAQATITARGRASRE
jgi:hypothetical protein